MLLTFNDIYFDFVQINVQSTFQGNDVTVPDRLKN